MDVHEYLVKLVCERKRLPEREFEQAYQAMCQQVQKDYPNAKPLSLKVGHLSTTIPFYDPQQQLAIYPIVLAYPKESLAYDMKADLLLAQQAGTTIKKIKVAYLNRNYRRQNKLDWSQLIRYGNMLANRKNHFHHSIASLVQKANVQLDRPLGRFELKKACLRCPQFNECFQLDLPDDSPFYLNTSPDKLTHLKQGITHIKELDGPQNRLQFAQFMASQLGSRFVDHNAISAWLAKIEQPVSFLDFEWQINPIPPYDGLKPFDALVFLASLHIQQDQLEHHVFFESGDARLDLIRFLIHHIPKTGSILVYNMEGAERLRINQLAEQFPAYHDELIAIGQRMVDLAKPFEAGLFYDNQMRGHYSLKAILPVFNQTLQYVNLKNGLDALALYQDYLETKDEQIKQQLIDYCSLDSLALVEIYQGLREVCDA